jgi:diguanylate cyclase (GGDEF)-like protein/PAS domain S-box-containing protein
MNTLSAVRAYVSGESLWSKAQKESIYHLNVYTKTHADSDYQKFLKAIDVPLNDKIARLELQKSQPDLKVATEAMIRAKNSPDDVPGMVQLFLFFHQTSLMKPSIQYWTQADQMIEQILYRAEAIRQQIKAGKGTPETIAPYIEQVNKINFQLTPLEDAFSNSLGHASRKAQLLIAWVMCVVTLVLMLVGIFLTRKIVLKNVTSANALHISEERWKFALEASRDGVWDWDIKTNQVMVSRQWKVMLGYADTEIDVDYKAWESRVHPEDLPKVLESLQAYIAGKASEFELEHRLLCKDGQYKWILTRGVIASVDKAGTPTRMVGTHADIDEMKSIEASLRESDTNQRALLEAMVDGVFVAQDHRFVFANPILPTMLGYEFDEFIGLPFDQVVAPDYLTLWNQRFSERMRDGVETLKNYQIRFLLKGGKESIWLDLHASPVEFRGRKSVLGILRDISKQKEAEEVIWQQANFDMLTGLPNRRMFRDRLEQEIKKSDRTGLTLAVLFLDLDNFKEVNDTMGHDKGDRLLKDVTKRLRDCVRETDTIARLGGDEFVILLSEMNDLGSLERIAKNILLSTAQPFQLDIEPVYITVSIGITLYPIDAHAFDDLMKNADQAMYAAKAEGRNRYSYFTPSMQAAAQSRMRLANDMRHAVSRNELRVVYQPIVEISTGEIHKAEALLRWHHPSLGLISPGQFIPIAEDTGLIHELGDWIFHEAVKQLVSWREQLDPKFQISVNKSPVQFKHANSEWLEHLESIGLFGESIVVEITENLLLDATDSVAEKLLQLRDAGIQVAIDDFGTGYSSLSYLKKYHIDYIKIDQSFVRNIAPDSSDMGLCEAIIVMAHKLDMQVIAEGVETQEQFDLLKEAGCDYAQGYLFSQPVTAEEFEKFFQSMLTE